jgi:hypothetical protein
MIIKDDARDDIEEYTKRGGNPKLFLSRSLAIGSFGRMENSKIPQPTRHIDLLLCLLFFFFCCFYFGRNWLVPSKRGLMAPPPP